MKVGDFGLARDVYSHLYYRANKHSRIPVKWAAPEMLNDGICTEKSDVVCNLTYTGVNFTYGTIPASLQVLYVTLFRIGSYKGSIK